MIIPSMAPQYENKKVSVGTNIFIKILLRNLLISNDLFAKIFLHKSSSTRSSSNKLLSRTSRGMRRPDYYRFLSLKLLSASESFNLKLFLSSTETSDNFVFKPPPSRSKPRMVNDLVTHLHDKPEQPSKSF